MACPPPEIFQSLDMSSSVRCSAFLFAGPSASKRPPPRPRVAGVARTVGRTEPVSLFCPQLNIPSTVQAARPSPGAREPSSCALMPLKQEKYRRVPQPLNKCFFPFFFSRGPLSARPVGASSQIYADDRQIVRLLKFPLVQDFLDRSTP